MGAPPADVAIDTRLAARLVAAQLPDLATASICPLGEGWDHALFAVGDDWVLRLPRRRERVAWLERERRILELVADALGDLVPRFERAGAPSELFPYPFVAYRRLAGTPVAAAPSRSLAADLGAFLGRLHAVDTAACPPTPDRWEDEAPDEPARALTSIAHHVVPWLAPPLADAAAPYLRGDVPAPAPSPTRRLVHNDLCAEHVLVDATGRLSGVVDFADAMVGDPVVDFVGLLTVGDDGFVTAVVDAYPFALDTGFCERLAWRSRTLTLTWLAEAAASHAVEPRHLDWVARAFGDVPVSRP